MYGISKQYGVTIEQITNWNKLTTSALSIGQRLIVGYGGAVSPKAKPKPIEEKVEVKPTPEPEPEPIKEPIEKPEINPDTNPQIKNNTIYHTVQPKEGLYSIAQKYGVTVDQIKEWNFLSSSPINIGQVLKVGKSDGNTLKDSEVLEKEPTPEKQAIYHTVLPKEGLYGISKQYNTTVDQIKSWNDLSSNSLSIGQKLIVGYK